jgi:ankyrin repeat protein
MNRLLLLFIAIIFSSVKPAEQKEPLTFLNVAKSLNAKLNFFKAIKESNIHKLNEMNLENHIKSQNLVNELNENGETGLMIAARIGNLAVLHFLLNNGSQVNAKNKEGKTSANLACTHLKGQALYNSLRLLKQYNADFSIEDKQGNSVESICKEFIEKFKI